MSDQPHATARRRPQARPKDEIAAIARFIRAGLDRDDFASTDQLLIAIDRRFPDITFRDFLAGYFLSDFWRQRGRRPLQ